jgi:hypothetical protein
MYDVLLDMNDSDSLFNCCTGELYDPLAHHRSRLKLDSTFIIMSAYKEDEESSS